MCFWLTESVTEGRDAAEAPEGVGCGGDEDGDGCVVFWNRLKQIKYFLGYYIRNVTSNNTNSNSKKNNKIKNGETFIWKTGGYYAVKKLNK